MKEKFQMNYAANFTFKQEIGICRQFLEIKKAMVQIEFLCKPERDECNY